MCISASVCALTRFPPPRQANAIGGRNEKAVKEFLEKQWAEGLGEEHALRLAIKALMEVLSLYLSPCNSLAPFPLYSSLVLAHRPSHSQHSTCPPPSIHIMSCLLLCYGLWCGAGGRLGQ